MAGSMSRNKGQRGEREARAVIEGWLAPVYESAGLGKPTLERNLMQSREGGYDLVGIDWLALEVKRHENLQLGSWWRQTLRQAKEGQVPFLMYRANRQAWKFRVRVATAHPTESGVWKIVHPGVAADLSADEAKLWLQHEAWWRLQA